MMRFQQKEADYFEKKKQKYDNLTHIFYTSFLLITING